MVAAAAHGPATVTALPPDHDIRGAVISALASALYVEPEQITGSAGFADLGLDSLDLAQMIVLLERSLGVDPFRAPPPGAARPAVRAVADLIAIYSQPAKPRSGGGAE